MKIINSNISDFREVTDNQDSSFPQANILTNQKNQVSKSQNNTITYKLSVNAQQFDANTKQGVFIGNTNAFEYSVVSKIGGTPQQTVTGSLNDVTYIGVDTTYSTDKYLDGGFVIEDSFTLTINDNVSIHTSEATNTDKQAFIELDSLLSDYTIEITITTAESILECGIVRSGAIFETFSPVYGLTESEKDNSVNRVMQSGDIYYKERFKQREFKGSFRGLKAEQYKVKSYFGRQLSNPVAIEVHNLNSRAIIFGRMQSPTNIVTNQVPYQDINFSIIEQV